MDEDGAPRLSTTEQRTAALLSALRSLQDALRDDVVVVVAAAETESRTVALLEAIQALHGALRQQEDDDNAAAIAAAAAAVAGGNDEEAEGEAPPRPPVVVPLPPPPADPRGADAAPPGPENPGGGGAPEPPEPGRRRRGSRDVPRRNYAAIDPLERRVTVHGYRAAVRLLEGADDDDHHHHHPRGRRPLDFLTVWDAHLEGEDGPQGEGDDALSFPRFVTLLGQPAEGEGEGGRTVRNLSLLADWERLPVEDVERLFGTVLPGHRTLQRIDINTTDLSPRMLQMLTESLPAAAEGSPLSSLSVCRFGQADPTVQAQEVRAIVDMLHQDVAIEELRVRNGMDSDPCKLLCQAVRRNNYVRKLSLRLGEVFADTLDGVTETPLIQLDVSGSFSEDAVSSLARQWRTNETLQYLNLRQDGDGPRDSQALLDLVRTYNYTLRRVDGDLGSFHDDAGVQEQFEGYRNRNERIRDAFKALRHPDPDLRLVAPPQLLPSVLGLVSDVPTALYRILKMDHVRNEIGGRRLDAQGDVDHRLRHHSP